MDRTPGERVVTGDSSPVTDTGKALVGRSQRFELDDRVPVSISVSVPVTAPTGTDSSRDPADSCERRVRSFPIQWADSTGLEIAGYGVAARITADGPDRFDRVRHQAGELFDRLEYDGPATARPRVFGGFAFHDDRTSDPTWEGFDSAAFVLPAVQVVRTGEDENWVTVLASDDEAAVDRLERWAEWLQTAPEDAPTSSADHGPGVEDTSRTTTPAEWTAQLEAALERIDDGDLRKVVLAQALTATLEQSLDLGQTLERLRSAYPTCYRFAIGGERESGTFFGAPPERLVFKRGETVETEALAGSGPRGETPAEDERHADRMLADDKLRREHDLVVEAICGQLEPFVDSLSIDDRRVRRLANIQHLRTPISGTLTEDRHVLELAEALHPTPAVGGVPPDLAWETIRDTESFDRGWYAGPVGWFDGDGDGEFAVGLRSGVASDDQVTLFAGNGIVADSDPEAEWEEVQLKFRPILEALR
ncbi:isochorismate synthase [Natrarchaeobaculum aegyptiacum]|uniref:isochorismate synthase n=1 Tax=Natrarchaeobaculum aegyptiacum TaxID=745377 RepID=A0A2Z2HWA3_9EURY|nr:isochorismate synthase [Natrarchaeobaculum aegyptiacum]ARS91541.1 isochorismate synthase [Natrarchaeobaculum aegyptiacum]